jgi:hypothetical protein
MMERQLVRIGASLGAALCAVIAAPLVRGQVYVRDDLASYYLPWRAFYARSLDLGQSFLWSPYVHAGFYAHGEGQAGMLHPLHFLLYRFLPLATAFNLENTLSYVFLLAGTYVLLRRWRFRAGAAMFGALVFAFSGFNLLHFVHPPIVAVLAHTPWLLWTLDLMLRSREPRVMAGAGLAVALLTASQLLLGHPQAVWLSLVLEGLYLLFRARAFRSAWRLGSVAQAKLLGLLAGSVQLLPTWDVVSASSRAAPAEFRASLVPLDLVQFVAPYLAANRGFGGPFPQDFAIYTGAIASVLMMWLVLRRRDLGRSGRFIWPALGLAAFGFILALGERGYVYRLEAALPLLGQFRTPSRYTVLVHFGMALGSAIAFADLVRVATRRAFVPWRTLAPLAILPAASALLVAASFWLRSHPRSLPEIAAQLGSSADALLGLALVTSATALVAMAARGAPWALPLIIIFVVVDQGYYGLSFLRKPMPPIELEVFMKAHAMPPETSEHRVQSDNNGLTMSGLRLAAGYGAFRPIGQLDPLDAQRLRLASVRFVQTRVPWARSAAELSGPNWSGRVRPAAQTYDLLGQASSWSEVVDPLPRAWLVSHEQVSREPARDIGSVDLRITALVAESHGLDEGPPGTAALVQEAQAQLRLDVVVPSRQLLVVSERWHAGWEVRVDGRPQPVVQAYGDFLGCVVEPGQHQVEFRFRPASFRVGAWLSGLGLVLTCGSFGLGFIRHSSPWNSAR